MLNRSDHDGVLELQLARPPVNALNPALVTELRTAIAEAPGQGARALILSGGEGMFSAGLDVPELLQLDRAAMQVFWKNFIDLLHTIAASPVPIVATITGHSPAGGAVLALFCDARFAAAGDFKMGLNEVQVGLPVPAIIHAALKRLVGARQAERLCLHGLLIAPEEARRIGLVDQVLPFSQLRPAALGWCRDLLALPSTAVAATRRMVRADLLAEFETLGSRSHEQLMQVWFSDETQGAMRRLVEQLRARKA